MTTEDLYFRERAKFIKEPSLIQKVEEEYTTILLDDILLPSAENIYIDFSIRPLDLLPF